MPGDSPMSMKFGVKYSMVSELIEFDESRPEA
jgi:hypothetical protein